MFYSHEILTSHQYGVATVWLAATIGPRSNIRRITRKAILDVDVPKACDTIIDPPGPPIALRLQANLLYGVSRVFDQQCTYTLTDAEKIQEHMRKFYSTWGTSNIDLNAGKAKRHQLILPDDPGFDLDFNLPELILDMDGNLFFQGNDSQKTSKTTSQLSPFERATSSPGSSINIGGLQIPRSSSLSNFGVGSPFAQDNMSQFKQPDDIFGIGDEDEAPIGNFGLEIDAFGNIIEPELPKMQQSQMNGDEEMREAQQGQHLDDQFQPLLAMSDGIAIDQPNAPNAQGEELANPQNGVADELAGSQGASAPQVRKKRPRKAKAVQVDRDGGDRVVRAEFRAWTDNYLENMERARKHPRTTAPAQAKRNAANLIFDLGLPGLSHFPSRHGHDHPLAEHFGRQALQTRFLGFVVDVDEDAPKRGRRRSSEEAFEDGEEGRRVRMRQDEEDVGAGQAIQQLEDAFGMDLEQDEEIEVGREPGSALSDHPSLPWNRPSPQVPGSSVLGSAQRDSARKAQGQESPLVGRGSVVHDIERYSDNAPFSSDGFQPAFADDVFSDGPDLEEAPPLSGANTSEMMREALDRDGQQFLGFLERIAEDKGKIRDAGEVGRHWIAFDDLFEADDRTRVAAAQAFYHVLSLATKGVISVEQEGQNKVAYGGIHIGVTLPEAEHGLPHDHGEMEVEDDNQVGE